jgi:hypothetical protein
VQPCLIWHQDAAYSPVCVQLSRNSVFASESR